MADECLEKKKVCEWVETTTKCRRKGAGKDEYDLANDKKKCDIIQKDYGKV